jgi:TrmH family RNA methyltransferase
LLDGIAPREHPPRDDGDVTAQDIASPSNPHVKAAAQLRNRRERERTGRTIVDGARELLRAIDAGVTIETAFVCDALVRSDDARAAVVAATQRAGRVFHTSAAAFEKVAFGDRAEGIVAVVHVPATALSELKVPPDPLVAVLEGIEKPGNLGAVLRGADGAAVDALVVADPRTDLFNPNTIRASLGTAFTVPLASASTADTLSFLRARGVRIIAARVAAATHYTDADLNGPLAIALGAEADGLSPAWSGPDVTAVRLPMLGVGDSLNVSVAAAILLYEARRQRGQSVRRTT